MNNDQNTHFSNETMEAWKNIDKAAERNLTGLVNNHFNVAVKPFNLEEAKAGKEVITETGFRGKYIFSTWEITGPKHVFLFRHASSSDLDWPAFVTEVAGSFEWYHLYTGIRINQKIYMAPVIKEIWVHLYRENRPRCEKGFEFGGFWCTVSSSSDRQQGDDSYIRSIKIHEYAE